MSKPFSRRTLRWLVVPAILLAGGTVWFLLARPYTPERTEVVPAVTVVRPERRDLEQRFSVRAFVEADRMVTVLPLVSGPIEELPVDIGDAVGADAVIARIDPERYRLDLAQAEASLAAAESTFIRTRQLYEANATAVQNFEQARAQYEAARSRRDLAELQLDYTVVRSPMDGVVLERHLASGDVAAPDRPIVTVGDLNRLVVRPAVPEQRYELFLENPGEMTVRVLAGERSYPARVRTVGPFVASETRTFEVVSDIVDDGGRLRPGMSVTVTFVPSVRRDVLSVPVGALGYNNTLWYVDGGAARSLSLETLESIGGRVLVPDEYEQEQFIIAGQHFLSEGQRVDVREPRS